MTLWVFEGLFSQYGLNGKDKLALTQILQPSHVWLYNAE